MEPVYLKLLSVFAVLAGVRVLTFVRQVPPRVRVTLSEYTDSGIIASVVAIFVVTFLLQVSRVEGISMEPSLQTGEYTLVNKLTYRWRVPQRGDVIVFRAPDNPHADYIKRVIAVPGETVEVRDGSVWVNGARLEEKYECAPPDYPFLPARVPAGHLFVLGDNRNRSYDSHLWEEPFLSIDHVRGQASVIVWPPADMGHIPGRPLEIPPSPVAAPAR
ncbi:MAG TPA: signal peptidase I [Armatimonadota bacterium]|jgi:signal peptidase I